MLYNFHVQDIIILLDVLSGLFIFKIVHYFSYLQSIHEYILVSSILINDFLNHEAGANLNLTWMYPNITFNLRCLQDTFKILHTLVKINIVRFLFNIKIRKY